MPDVGAARDELPYLLRVCAPCQEIANNLDFDAASALNAELIGRTIPPKCYGKARCLCRQKVETQADGVNLGESLLQQKKAGR